MLLSRANEAARAGSIAAAARRRVIGRRNRHIISSSSSTTTTIRAASSLLSYPHHHHYHSTAYRAPPKNTVGTTMNQQPLSPASGATAQRPLNRSPNNTAGLWNPSKGIHFAAAGAAAATAPNPIPAPLAAHTTPKFKRRRRVDLSAQPPPPVPSQPFSKANHFQTSARNASVEAESEHRPKEVIVIDSDEALDDDDDVPAAKATYKLSRPSSDQSILMDAEKDAPWRKGFQERESLESYWGGAKDKSDLTIEPQEYNEKVWMAAQSSKRSWDRKVRPGNTTSERAASIEELLIADGKVDFWDIVSPFDKAVKLYKDHGQHAETYREIAMAKHKRDARVTDVDKMQLPMLEKQPDPHILEEYFSLRATTFEIYVAYALAGPLELRKLYELMLAEKKLLKTTSTMQREIMNKRYLRDEEILGLGLKVNIPSPFRIPRNYSLTNADTEVLNTAFEKSPLDGYHASGAANPWDQGDTDDAPGIFVPPVRFPGAEDIGHEDEGATGRLLGNPRTRFHRRQIQRAMFWAQRYTELSWRTRRMRIGKAPGGGVSWSQKAFTMEDVDDIMKKFNLKPASQYMHEDVLTRSVENTNAQLMPWDEDRSTWDGLPTAKLDFEDIEKVPATDVLYPDTKEKFEVRDATWRAAREASVQWGDTLKREFALLKEAEMAERAAAQKGEGTEEANIEMADEELWSADESEEAASGKNTALEELSDSEEITAAVGAVDLDAGEFIAEDVEEVVELEAEIIESSTKKKRLATSKLADKDEPPYLEPAYFLDSTLVAKNTRTDRKAGTKVRPFFSYRLYSKSRLQGQELPTAPSMIYCETVAQMDNAMKRFEDCKVLGFDMEWAAFGFSKNPKYNVSLIQIASNNAIVLFHLAMMNKYEFPQRLKEVIEDESVVKTGVAIKGDATRLLKHWGVRANGLIDLSAYHKVIANGPKDDLKRPSLALLTEHYIKLELSKDPKIRRGHWERALSLDQRLYAANDAYACVRIFDEMERKRHNIKPRPARPDVFQSELPVEVETKPKRKKAGQSIAEEDLEAMSKEPYPLDVLKEHQAKLEAEAEAAAEAATKVEAEELGEENEEVVVIERTEAEAEVDIEAKFASESDSDDSFQRLPTPDGSSSESEGKPAPAAKASAKSVKKTLTATTQTVKTRTQRAVITDISGKRDFSTTTVSSTFLKSPRDGKSFFPERFRPPTGSEKHKKVTRDNSKDERSSAAPVPLRLAENTYLNEYSQVLRWVPPGPNSQTDRDIVVGDPELMRSTDVAGHGRGIVGGLGYQNRGDDVEHEGPPEKSSEHKFEREPPPFRTIGKKEAHPKPPKYQLKAICKEPDHEEPNNGPPLKAIKPPPIRRIYPPELKIAQAWANFVINNEMVPRQKRTSSNPGGSGNQLAIYHLWHIQGFHMAKVQALLSAYNSIAEDKVHERLCQAIAMFPVSYDRIRLAKEVFMKASQKTKETKFFADAMQRYIDDKGGKARELEPTWITSKVTQVDKDYQVDWTVNNDSSR